MARLSPEKLFKQKYPHATVERQRTTGYVTYYLVRKNDGVNPANGRPVQSFMPFGEGDTAAQAWRDACEREGLIEKQTPEAK